jgi:hypothetical protein
MLFFKAYLILMFIGTLHNFALFCYQKGREKKIYDEKN